MQLIEELCGDLAFRYVGDIFDAEHEALRSGADPDLLVISDEGEWFPSTTPDDSFNLDTVVRGLQDKFQSLSAEQIRALIQNPKAAAFLKENMAREFPLANVYGSGLLDRFLSNSVSGYEMSRELMKGFTKPGVLIGHYLEGNPKAQKLFSNLASMERQLLEQSVRIRDGLKPHMELVLGLGKDVVKRTRKAVQQHRSKLSAPYLRLEEIPERLRESIEQGRFLKELPAVSTHYNLLIAYTKDIIYPSPAMPEIKESDTADILHATYFPYVDLYRTDGRFSSLVSGLPKPSRVRVVPKLHQLPDAITKELERRSNASGV